MFAVRNPFERSLTFEVERDVEIELASDSIPAIQRSIMSVVIAAEMVAAISRIELNLGMEVVAERTICPTTGRSISKSILAELDSPTPIPAVKFRMYEIHRFEFAVETTADIVAANGLVARRSTI
jgi:hypothetical protein